MAAGLTGILPYTSWPVIYFFVVIITILVLNSLRSATGRHNHSFVKMKYVCHRANVTK